MDLTDLDITTEQGLIEAYVFQQHVGPPGIDAVMRQFIAQPGVQFVGQFIGAFSLFARVTASDLSELQGRIATEYAEAGIGSNWSVNLTAKSAAAPKRGSPPMCALVMARTDGDPFDVWESIDHGFLDKSAGEGAAVLTARGFDLLVDLGADDVNGLVRRVNALRAQPGIGRTATAIADITAALRP